MAAVDQGQAETEFSTHEEKDEYFKEFQRQLLYGPGLWSLTKRTKDIELEEVLALARKALIATREAVSLAENGESSGLDVDNPVIASLGSMSLNESDGNGLKYVKSTRRLERQSTLRDSKSTVTIHKSASRRIPRVMKKSRLSAKSPHQRFMRSETGVKFSVEEERELILQIKDFLKLVDAKKSLETRFRREPTLDEWAEAVGLSTSALQSRIDHGEASQRKFVQAHYGLVVCLAHKKQKRGLAFQDLLQAGSLGLLNGLRKYEPTGNCRFSTYAYVVIRDHLSDAVHEHSKTVRLPRNAYRQLSKVLDARSECIKDGNQHPTDAQIAARAGIPLEKVEDLLHATQKPISMQQFMWSHAGGTTMQAVVADPSIDDPEASVSKRFMREKISSLLSKLSPEERKILWLRYGLEDGNQRKLSDIGAIFGLTKARIQQLETETINKVKQCLEPEELGAYADLFA